MIGPIPIDISSFVGGYLRVRLRRKSDVLGGDWAEIKAEAELGKYR